MGKIFGGFTNIPWTSPKILPYAFPDRESFIFSLDNRTIHRPKNLEAAAITHYVFWPPAFGNRGSFGTSRADIWVDLCCAKWEGSHCDLGATYQLPKGIKYGTDEAKNYLAGSHNFKVLDYEVFQLVLR